MAIALSARGIWKSYAAGVAGCSARVWVLRGASVEVAHGECLAVLGAPRAGTTTLLHCLAGLQRVDAGTVEHRGTELLAPARAPRPLVGEPARDRVLLVDDDRLVERWRGARRLDRARFSAAALVVATHELARVRCFADRILLLRAGRLLPLDQATGLRRVAEQRRATSGTRGPECPETGLG